jgi:hypothetical protein
VLVVAVLGVPAGLIWSYVAPRAPYLATPAGPRLADPSTQSLIAADGWFAVVTGVAGLLCGAVAVLIARRGALPVLVGLAGGGLAAAYLAEWIGGAVNLGPAAVSASGVTGTVVPGALVLTAPGVIVTWPLIATAAFGLVLGATTPRDTSPLDPLDGDPYGPVPPRDLSR